MDLARCGQNRKSPALSAGQSGAFPVFSDRFLAIPANAPCEVMLFSGESASAWAEGQNAGGRGCGQGVAFADGAAYSGIINCSNLFIRKFKIYPGFLHFSMVQ